jgi:hypothetical protein
MPLKIQADVHTTTHLQMAASVIALCCARLMGCEGMTVNTSTLTATPRPRQVPAYTVPPPPWPSTPAPAAAAAPAAVHQRQQELLQQWHVSSCTVEEAVSHNYASAHHTSCTTTHVTNVAYRYGNCMYRVPISSPSAMVGTTAFPAAASQAVLHLLLPRPPSLTCDLNLLIPQLLLHARHHALQRISHATLTLLWPLATTPSSSSLAPLLLCGSSSSSKGRQAGGQ